MSGSLVLGGRRLPVVASVAASAHCGGFLRPSRRSPSGWVYVACAPRSRSGWVCASDVASVFRALWAPRVRSSPSGLAVSVPVSLSLGS